MCLVVWKCQIFHCLYGSCLFQCMQSDMSAIAWSQFICLIKIYVNTGQLYANNLLIYHANARSLFMQLTYLNAIPGFGKSWNVAMASEIFWIFLVVSVILVIVVRCYLENVSKICCLHIIKKIKSAYLACYSLILKVVSLL